MKPRISSLISSLLLIQLISCEVIRSETVTVVGNIHKDDEVIHQTEITESTNFRYQAKPGQIVHGVRIKGSGSMETILQDLDNQRIDVALVFHDSSKRLIQVMGKGPRYFPAQTQFLRNTNNYQFGSFYKDDVILEEKEISSSTNYHYQAKPNQKIHGIKMNGEGSVQVTLGHINEQSVDVNFSGGGFFKETIKIYGSGADSLKCGRSLVLAAFVLLWMKFGVFG